MLLLGLLWLGATSWTPPPARIRLKPVIVTTDCGVDVDDQWALADLLLSRRIQVRAIIGTHAPGHTSAASAACARQVIRRVHRYAPPVFTGAARALRGRPRRANAGVRFLLRAARLQAAARPRLTVVSIGAATDVAAALLFHPALARQIRLVAMGFKAEPGGGSEYNINNDPRAWQVIFHSRVPLVIGAANICERYLTLRAAQARAMLAGRGPLGAWMAAIFAGFIRQHPGITRQFAPPDSWVEWDPITAAYLLGFARTRTLHGARYRFRCQCISYGHHSGDTVHWITGIRRRAFWRDLERKVGPRSRP
jgi:purine nucleosidase